jgi:hypothetical protein
MNQAETDQRRPTIFQIVITGWLVLLTVVVVGGAIYLLRLQRMAEENLTQAAQQLQTLHQEHINYTVTIDQIVPVSTTIDIDENIAVPISITVAHTVQVDDAIPFEQELAIPVNFEVDRVFPVSTTIPFSETINLTINRSFDIDNDDIKVPVTIPGLGSYVIPIPIQARIPINFPISVPIERDIPIEAEIPINLPISETFTVVVSRTVPVQLDIPINIPVETEVIVPINRTIPVQAEIPIALDVPIDIAIADTPFGDYLLELSDSLREVSGRE